MSPPETPNPERRSDAALLCLCLGGAFAAAAWLLGVGSAIGVAFFGANPAVLLGGLVAAIGLMLLGLSGFVLMAVGAIWLFVRVIADQRADDRYGRDVNL